MTYGGWKGLPKMYNSERGGVWHPADLMLGHIHDFGMQSLLESGVRS